MLRFARVGAVAIVLAAPGCSIDFDRFRDAAADAGATDAGPDSGLADAGVDAAGPLVAPAPVFPWNGYDTGTAREPAPGTGARPKRPTFRWSRVPGAERYEIAIGEGCEPGFVPDCDLTVELVYEASTEETHHVPTEDLPALARDPESPGASGSRLYWQVRACRGPGECSPWADSRYLDVGRLPDDYDGDGYSDLLVGEPTRGTDPGPGAAYVFEGPDLDGGRAIGSGADPYRLGVSAAALGDVDGDGFADAAIADGGYGAPRPSRIHVLLGSPDGLPVDVRGGVALEPAEIGLTSMAGAGDLDADGYDDVVVGIPGADVGSTTGAGVVHVHYGSEAGIDTEPSLVLPHPVPTDGAVFGFTVAGVGDVDGDGYADLGVAAVSHDAGGIDAGRAYVFPGGPDGVASERRILLANPEPQDGAYFGLGFAGRVDVDGAGAADVAVSAILHDVGGVDDVGVFYRYGGGTDPSPALDGPFECPDAVMGARCGGGLAFGDVHGDGTPDLVVGAPNQDSAAGAGTGAAYLLPGPDLHFDDAVPLGAGHDQRGMKLGERVYARADYDGDGRSDVAVSARRYTPSSGTPHEPGALLVFFGADLAEGAVSPRWLQAPTPRADAWFGSSVGAY